MYKRLLNQGYRCAFALVVFASLAPLASADIIDSRGAGFSFPDDDAGGMTSTINIGANETILDVDVTLFDLNHTWVGDLIAQITSPTGTTSDLFFRVGPGTFGDGSNLNGDYTFSDGGANWLSAAQSVGGGGNVPEGTYQPSTNGDLPVSLTTAFAGESTQGTWTLFISDNAEQDLGSLGSWGLSITSTTAVPEPGPMLLVFLAGAMFIKRRKRSSGSRLATA